MKKTHLLIVCFAIFLFSFAPQLALAGDPDCSIDPVTLGEVMAGLQADITSAGINEETLASGFYDANSGIPTRGFVIPESGVPTEQCENDYILIGFFLGCYMEDDQGITTKTPKEARDCVDSGFDGLIIDYYFEIDGFTVPHIQTATKIGYLPSSFFPGERKGALYSAGIIIEPFELAIGPHEATVLLVLDVDKDGEPDDILPLTTEFVID